MRYRTREERLEELDIQLDTLEAQAKLHSDCAEKYERELRAFWASGETHPIPLWEMWEQSLIQWRIVSLQYENTMRRMERLMLGGFKGATRDG